MICDRCNGRVRDVYVVKTEVYCGPCVFVIDEGSQGAISHIAIRWWKEETFTTTDVDTQNNIIILDES